jgi:hypothetical protein
MEIKNPDNDAADALLTKAIGIYDRANAPNIQEGKSGKL